MKTVNIKGKDYVEVNERVKYFRTSKESEGWSIETKLLKFSEGVCVVKATVLNAEGRKMAEGLAYEREDSTFINKTSYLENCETSAVGRALGFLGIGIDTSIASSDEVQNAMQNQTNAPAKNGLDFDDLRLKYSKMTKDELRKEYVSVKVSKAYTDKQKDAIGKIILKAQEGKE
jgi:hypothetical protein